MHIPDILPLNNEESTQKTKELPLLHQQSARDYYKRINNVMMENLSFNGDCSFGSKNTVSIGSMDIFGGTAPAQPAPVTNTQPSSTEIFFNVDESRDDIGDINNSIEVGIGKLRGIDELSNNSDDKRIEVEVEIDALANRCSGVSFEFDMPSDDKNDIECDRSLLSTFSDLTMTDRVIMKKLPLCLFKGKTKAKNLESSESLGLISMHSVIDNPEKNSVGSVVDSSKELSETDKSFVQTEGEDKEFGSKTSNIELVIEGKPDEKQDTIEPSMQLKNTGKHESGVCAKHDEIGIKELPESISEESVREKTHVEPIEINVNGGPILKSKLPDVNASSISSLQMQQVSESNLSQCRIHNNSAQLKKCTNRSMSQFKGIRGHENSAQLRKCRNTSLNRLKESIVNDSVSFSVTSKHPKNSPSRSLSNVSEISRPLKKSE